VTKSEVFQFISSKRLCVIATADRAGRPESALIGFAFDARLGLVFDTSASSRKVANLRARPEAALVIGWEDETTVQLEGIAVAPLGDALARAKAMYFAVWPDGREREAWPDIEYFVIKPRWIRYQSYAVPSCLVEFSLPA
jgi:pyridoxine/pyridoxamine 5'-phosphate oxidase